MMATPADLEDFAFGFSLNEGIVGQAREIEAVRIVEAEAASTCRSTLWSRPGSAAGERRRAIAGPVGCGLCGVESIEAALRRPPCSTAKFAIVATADHREAVASLTRPQPLNARRVPCMPPASGCPAKGRACSRCARMSAGTMRSTSCAARWPRSMSGAAGAIVVTSRVSVEMVQKTAALRQCLHRGDFRADRACDPRAQAANITLVALVRGSEFDVFTHRRRIVPGARAHVA